ncbi:hypothetical protein [Nitrosomonas marina]|uniref:DUF3168 domain-containing protein n=1 Tax=Nitrosomonas marina TaxID=917 RepID=A0A1H8GH68_9PROT|nr:hypothetical protein [Nitrosomonas marina]SEN43366.1 hypothetical protein SAMN05216325_11823 [Nitrosomonas marina]
MNLRADINSALSPLAEVYPVRLPDSPVFPAVVYRIDTEPETGWTPPDVYSQHDVEMFIYSSSLSQLMTIRDQIKTLMSTLSDGNGAESEGDADYEDDARVYAYYMDFRIRTRELT